MIIECDGPSHYSCNKPFVNTGPTVLRNAILRGLGYDVIVVAHHELRGLHSVEQLRAMILGKAIAATQL